MLDRYDCEDESQVDVKYATVPVSCWLSIEARWYEWAEVVWLLGEQAAVLLVGLMVKLGCRELRWREWWADTEQMVRDCLAAAEVQSLLFSHHNSLAAIFTHFFPSNFLQYMWQVTEVEDREKLRSPFISVHFCPSSASPPPQPWWIQS